jgi:hypothetical protein
MDVIAQYDAGNSYIGKYNNIQKRLLSNNTIPINVNLYDLYSTNSTEFKVTFKDSNFIKKPNVLVDISRKYIEDGIFRTVEVAKTDSKGETIVHLQLSDAIYTLTFTYLGEVLAILDNVIAKCQNPLYSECTIDVNSYSSVSTIQDFNYINGINLDESFNENTKTVTSTFISESGTNTLVMNITKFDRFGNTTICTDTITSSTGSLSCLIPDSYGNSSILVETYSNGNLISRNIYSLGNKNPDTTGSSVILALMIVLTLSMLFIADIRGILLGCFIGLILSGALLYVNSGNLFSQGSAITWLLVALIIIIWKINKREEY